MPSTEYPRRFILVFVYYLVQVIGLTTGFNNDLSSLVNLKFIHDIKVDSAYVDLIKYWDFRLTESKSLYSSSNGSGKNSFFSPGYRPLNPLDFKKDAVGGINSYFNYNKRGANAFFIDENRILLKVSGLISFCVQRELFSLRDLFNIHSDSSFWVEICKFLAFSACGGWFTGIGYHSIVDLNPRALFLNADPLEVESVVFPCTATVQVFTGGMGYNLGHPAVLINPCSGSLWRTKADGDINYVELYNNKAGSSISPSFDLIPGNKIMIPGTELTPLLDPFPMLHNSRINELNLSETFPTIKSLSVLLKESVCEISLENRAEEMDTPRSSTTAPSSKGHDEPGSWSIRLASSVAEIRSILLQLVRIESYPVGNKEYLELSALLNRTLNSIIELAAVDYVSAVLSILDSLKLKSGQLDILRNLLREEDCSFLEKIALRLWPALRYMKASVSRKLSKSNTKLTEKMPCSVLAGEVQIFESKVRALNHFPSIRILDILLYQGSGRWFYECTLLTDGLMQIGWAAKSFRCDPVCGQGIGDHPYSWAYDGFRTKKWNVSCENYGKRWRIGDVVGVLVDMDLLEIRFYLNGNDLGVAFSGFQCDTIYPAISMNVRQVVRINYGQYNFTYPPTLVDKIKFRPIKEAESLSLGPNSYHDKKKEKSNKKVATAKNTADTEVKSAIENTEKKIFNTGEECGVSDEVTVAPTSPDKVAGELVASESKRDTSEIVQLDEDKDESLKIDFKSEPGEGSENETPVPSNRLLFSDSEGSPSQITDAKFQAESNACDSSKASRDDDINSDDSESNDSDDENDVGEDDDLEDDDDALDEMNAERATHRQTDLNPELELRRQALIENLIGMGFPVDWALRAAEHCDASVSESAAISWIIERMELEQAKLDEFEGSDSRMVEEEEYDETNESGYENLQRATRGAEAAAENRMNNLNRNSVLNGGQEATGVAVSTPPSGSGGGTCTSSTNAQSNSKNVPPSGSASNSINGTETEQSANNVLGQYYDSLAMVFYVNDESGIPRIYTPMDENLGNGFGVWNGESGYPSITPGRYSTPRKYRADKQDILLQVSDLNIDDLYPIIMASQFSLCVLYARFILLRSMKLLSFSKSLRSSVKPKDDLILRNFLVHDKLQYLVLLLPSYFKHTLGGSSYSDNIFPVLVDGNSEKLPFFAPFVDIKTVNITEQLADLERFLCNRNTSRVSASNSCMGSLTRFNQNALRESTACTLYTVRMFLSCLHRWAFIEKPSVEISKQCEDLQRILVDDAIYSLEEASHHQYYRCDWITGDGYDRIGGKNVENVDICVQSSRSMDNNSENKRGDSEPISTTDSGSGFYRKPKVFVLWAYFTLVTFLREECESSSESNVLYSSMGNMEKLMSIDFLLRIVKICLCPNMALRFCILDIALIIINQLMALVLKGRKLDGDPEVLNNIGKAISESSMLDLLSSRLKFEAINRKKYSKYAVRSILFFLQWRKFLSMYFER